MTSTEKRQNVMLIASEDISNYKDTSIYVTLLTRQVIAKELLINNNSELIELLEYHNDLIKKFFRIW